MTSPIPPSASAKPLRRKLFAYQALALLSLALFLFISTNRIFTSYLQKAEDKGLLHNVELRSLAVSQWRKSNENLALQITSRTRVREELEKFNAGKISSKTLRDFTTSKLVDAMKLSEDIKGIIRLDKNNEVVCACGMGEEFIRDKKKLAKYISDDRISISDPFDMNGQSLLIVSAQILSPNKKRQGVDLVMVSTESLHPLVCVPDAEELLESIALIYFDGSQYRPVCLRDNIHPEICGEEKLYEFSASPINKPAEVSNINGSTISFTKVPESNWLLIATSSTNALYAPVREKMTILAIVFLLIYAAILTGFWALLNPLAESMLLRMDELEEKISQRTAEKEAVINELKEALAKIQTLSGLLPICGYCKKVRDDKGYWNQIESYIRKHSEADFSHSICPDCLKEHYPDTYERMKQNGNI